MDDGVIQEFLVDGKELFELGYYEELRNLCKDFLDKVKDERIYALLTVAEYTLEDYAAAEDAARKGMALNSSDPDILFNLACIMKVTGRYSNAWRFFNRAEKYADEDLKTACKEEMSAIEEYLGITSAVLCPPKQNKRVLIIAAIYPPESGSGVQRTLKLVKYLRLYGWEPVVVTYPATENPTFSGLNYFDELPDDIEVIRIPSKSSISMADIEMIKDRLMPMLSDKTRKEFKLIYSRLNINQKYELCSFPDKSIYWAYEVADHIEQYVDMSAIDLVYSTSGPYSDHFAGYYVKERFQKPWVVDFRDEWSNNPAIWPDKISIIYQMCVNAEQSILKVADEIICVTELSYDNYLKLGVNKINLTCITNGYDEEDFEGIGVKQVVDNKFIMVHNGLLYIDRTPFTMFEALANLLNKKKIERDKVVFHIGNFTNKELEIDARKKIAFFQLEDIAYVTPYLEHRESLELAVTAKVLILILGPEDAYKATYPAKVFEYLRLGKPILSLGPSHSVIERLLLKTKQGVNVNFRDISAIESEIEQRYKDWVNGKEIKSKGLVNVLPYSRKTLAKRHADVFNRVHNKVPTNSKCVQLKR